MKRILAMAVLLAMPTWAGQKLPTTQTKETPWRAATGSPTASAWALAAHSNPHKLDIGPVI